VRICQCDSDYVRCVGLHMCLGLCTCVCLLVCETIGVCECAIVDM